MSAMNEQTDAIVGLLELHAVSLIKVAGLLQHGHMSAAEVLEGVTIATEELLALKKLLTVLLDASTGDWRGARERASD